MKKTSPLILHLRRETLQLLEPRDTAAAAGGATNTSTSKLCTVSCLC